MRINLPLREVYARYAQRGKWFNDAGQLRSTEQIVAESYQSQGYNVKTWANSFIQTCVATLLAPVIQDPDDPQLSTGIRRSTRGWFKNHANAPTISIVHPGDFGSRRYYERRSKEFGDWFERLKLSSSLAELFEELLEKSTSLRDYLWVNEDYAVELARTALRTIPQETVLTCMRWTVEDYWHRRPGWPNLFVYGNNRFLFVKSQYSRLSQDHVNWFEWTVKSNIPCEICRVKKRETM